MIKAIIFDMDGVLVDSENYHLDSYNNILKQFNIQLTTKDFKDLFGRGSKQIMIETFKRQNINADPIKFAKLKNIEYRRLIKGNITPLPGVSRLIDSVKDKLKICVASSSTRENVKTILTGLDIIDDMEFYLSSDDVSDTKPDPEIFQLAVRKLNLNPNECIVIEDADLGIRAAKGAGIKVIAVTTTLPRDRLKQADLIVDSLEDIDYGTITNLR